MNPISIQKGIITEKLQESKEFYSRWLGMTVKFEAEWFLLMCLSDKPEFELGFMLPGQKSLRKSYFQKPYEQQGIWLIFETENVKAFYNECKKKGAPIDLDLTEEEWGDVHFTMLDPNGIGIDIVQLRS
ncbi:VOC family protein [Leptospira sp. 'Mane']|uniref:VOC family protein n=1 Tax=Leptospira sp. 'Mane' TaxID=3387407 RepID=UPI00398B84CC